ncbi:hypothetical protein FS749_011099 [Ceratobasidium sp. UAMH 11750]|nr:hypothetical protein FS749_011099 [Ceratobasidium sp. UAMH 11750]
MSRPQNPGVPAGQNSGVGVPQNLGKSVLPTQGMNPHIIPQNPSVGAPQNPGVNVLPTQNLNPPTTQPQDPTGPQTWHGQIVYRFQRPEDNQTSGQAHFNAIAISELGLSIETNRWPSQLSVTSGFKPLSRAIATQLYSSPLPFGQIVIDPIYAGTEPQHAVFREVITSGYSIFYEFPNNNDPMNPPPSIGPVGSARGLLFFSVPSAPNHILFKVFITYPCPPALCRGGQPVVLRFMENNGNRSTNANGAAGANGVNGGGAVPGAGAPPAPVPAGVPGTGLGGQPNAVANNIRGIRAPGAVPGTGLGVGMVPGADMIPCAGIAPGAAMMPGVGAGVGMVPTQLNASGCPGLGINPGMMLSWNTGGVLGVGSSGMPGLGGVPGAGAGLPGPGTGLPDAGLGGQPNAGASCMRGIQAPGIAPGAGLVAGMVPGAVTIAAAGVGVAPTQLNANAYPGMGNTGPGMMLGGWNAGGIQAPSAAPGAGLVAGMIPGARAGLRPNPASTQPNASAYPAMGINPGLVQGFNPSGIPGLGSSAISGFGGGGVPGLNPNNVLGLTQASVPVGLPANQPSMNEIYRLARLGLTLAQFASATPRQQVVIRQQVQQMMMRLNQQQQQAAANGMGMAHPPGIGGLGQPGFEQLQAFTSQQQRQGGQ